MKTYIRFQKYVKHIAFAIFRWDLQHGYAQDCIIFYSFVVYMQYGKVSDICKHLSYSLCFNIYAVLAVGFMYLQFI